ncbi:MAG: molybdopterin-dependent oxidoreductase [Pseudomonadota bacterium]
MTAKHTAAHWGAYKAVGEGAALRLEPLSSDANPSLIGQGWVAAMRDPATRIGRPAIRKGWLDGRERAIRCRDSHVEVPWDEALDLVAEELKRVIADYGNEAIFAGSYGWASTGRFHHAQSQMRRFLNTIGGFTASRTTYSHAAAEIIFPYITGFSNVELQESMTSWPLIERHCELLVAFGGISGRTAQISSAGTSEHEVETWLQRIAAKGIEIVNISPQASDFSDAEGAAWLPIRPGSDVALMLALAHEIHAQGRTDRAFLERYTSGWAGFEAYLTGRSDGVAKTPAWAAPLCDLPVSAIEALARQLMTKRSMITVTWGLQRADHGEQPIWMGLTLAAVLGQIGQPGLGFGFGYGSVTPVGRPARFLSWPSLPQGRNPVSARIPVARIADMLLHPGAPYHFDGQVCHYPDIKLVWWAGGNPYHHHQDLLRLEEAWCRPETVIVTEHSWTATARRADIVLPATSPLERADIMVNKRDTRLIFMEPLLTPFGEAKNDHQIMVELSRRFGTEAAFSEGRDEEAWLRWLWAGCGQVAEAQGFSLPDFDSFRATGVFACPDSEETKIVLGDFVADPEAKPLATESGRITIGNQTIAAMALPDCAGHPCWYEPAEWLGAAEPDQLHLITPQPLTRLHAQLDAGPVSQAGKVNGHEACTLHPETAARFGIAAGESVLIENSRGACLAGAVLSEGIRKDCIALPTGAWLDLQEIDGRLIDVSGNPNVLTLDKGCSGLSQGNIAHTALVRISRWDGPKD